MDIVHHESLEGWLNASLSTTIFGARMLENRISYTSTAARLHSAILFGLLRASSTSGATSIWRSCCCKTLCKGCMWGRQVQPVRRPACARTPSSAFLANPETPLPEGTRALCNHARIASTASVIQLQQPQRLWGISIRLQRRQKFAHSSTINLNASRAVLDSEP